jgi:arylsulfatase A-like enzyme
LPSGRAKEIKQAYCASISFVDAQIGRVLTALRSTGLAENTVVVFLSDHGYHLGEHGHWQKQTLFEEATRVPLFILDPRHETADARVPQPVELVDLYPTLNELAGIPTPEYVAGRSLVPRMREEVVESGGGALTQWRQGLSLRTSQHRLTMWGRDGELGMELYDHQEDPGEENNLALVPGHEALIDSLRGWMEEKTKSTSPLPPSIGRMNLDAPPMPWSPPLFRDGEVTPLLHSTPTTP